MRLFIFTFAEVNRVMKEKLNKLLNESYFSICLMVLIALAVSIQSLMEGERLIDGGYYTHYNNYLIFKQSFYHLIHNQDLYAYYAAEHFDLFKYSPTFALLFAPFAVLPDFLGLTLWNVFNLLVFVFALLSLPNLSVKTISLIVLLSILEIITTAQNEQSNTLMIALFLFAFSSLESRKYFIATLFLVLSIYLKLYGVVALSMFLFYPDKWKLAAYSVFWFIVLLCLPLIFVEYNQLLFNYKSWLALLTLEHDQIYGISVMGWLSTWFSYERSKFIPVFIGIILFCLPLVRIANYNSYSYRLLALCSVLIWVVIFNHRAESASYIIAYTGIAIWFMLGKQSLWKQLFMLSAFVLITLSPSDLFPRYLREEYVQAYTLKALPAILIWLLILMQMWKRQNEESTEKVKG